MTHACRYNRQFRYEERDNYGVLHGRSERFSLTHNMGPICYILHSKEPSLALRQLSKIDPIRHFAKMTIWPSNNNLQTKVMLTKTFTILATMIKQESSILCTTIQITNANINTNSNVNNNNDQVWLLRPSREAPNCKLPRRSPQRFSIIDDVFIFFSSAGSWCMTTFLCCALMSLSLDWSIHPEQPQSCLLQGFYAEGEHVPTPEYRRR